MVIPNAHSQPYNIQPGGNRTHIKLRRQGPLKPSTRTLYFIIMTIIVSPVLLAITGNTHEEVL